MKNGYGGLQEATGGRGDAEGTFSPRRKTLIFLSDVPFYSTPPNPPSKSNTTGLRGSYTPTPHITHCIGFNFLFRMKKDSGCREKRKTLEFKLKKQKKSGAPSAFSYVSINIPHILVTLIFLLSLYVPSSCSHDNGDC